MDILEVMRKRHSVRQYEDRAIEPEKRHVLNDWIAAINADTGLHIPVN